MKVGIVSIYDNGNFGNRLQNYALQEILKQYADEVVTIKNKASSNSKLDRIARTTGIIDIPFVNSLLGKKRRACMLRFTNRYIKNSRKYYYHDKSYNYPIENCDMYCCGSDQVWNPNLKVTGLLHFLGFSNSENNFSFAASFGVNYIEDPSIKDIIIRGLKNFKHISVRESAGKKLIQSELKVAREVEVLIDPTLYFTARKWERIERKPSSLIDKKWILIYFLGGCTHKRRLLIEKLASANDCKIIDLMDIKSKLFSEVGPSEFLYLIHHARLVCTDSFHASVFSFIFEKPLYIFDRKGSNSNMSSRIDTLVEKFNLALINDEVEKLEINKPDYSRGYIELEKEKEKVNNYLEKVFKDKQNRESTKLYACYNNNDEIRKCSSSGGIYYPIAMRVIKSGGVVYAVCLENLIVKYKRIDTVENIGNSCGAKYIQSELGDTFRKVSVDLQNGIKVLFVGLPCHCSGLKKYIGDNSNLICVDFVCHGVPSKKAWRYYLDSMAKQGFRICSVNMRDKSSGWKQYNWNIKTEEGKNVISSRKENHFMKGFLNNLFLRPCCYRCQFKGIERGTDITLGDYWGIETAHPEMYDDKGVSCVMIHSEIGRLLFDTISSDLYKMETTALKLTKSNPSVILSPMKPKESVIYRTRMQQGADFCNTIDELTRPNVIRDLVVKTDRVIKRLRWKLHN